MQTRTISQVRSAFPIYDLQSTKWKNAFDQVRRRGLSTDRRAFNDVYRYFLGGHDLLDRMIEFVSF